MKIRNELNQIASSIDRENKSEFNENNEGPFYEITITVTIKSYTNTNN